MSNTFRCRRDWPSNRHILFQRIGLINQHIRARRREPLIVNHVALRHAVGGVVQERHWMVGSLTYSSNLSFSAAGQSTVCLSRGNKESCAFTPAAAMSRTCAKRLRAGLEDVQPSASPLSLCLSGSIRKMETRYSSRKILRRLGAELRIAQMDSFATRPSPMDPGSVDQCIRRVWIARRDSVETLKVPLKVLRVKPAPHRHHRDLTFFMCRDRFRDFQ